jgi:hypothetical protein
VDVAAWLAGIGAIVSAGIGLTIVIRNARRQGRKSALEEADAAEQEVEVLRSELLQCRKIVYDLKQTLVNNGIEVP